MKMPLIFSDIYWVFWREIRKFIQQKARIVMTIVQPTVWLVLMGNAMSGLTNNPLAVKMMGTANYLSFMMPGVMIMTSLFGGAFGGTSILWDRRLGFLNKMLTAPINRAAIPIGKLLAIGLQTMFQAFIIIIIAFILRIPIAAGISGIIGLVLIVSLFGMIMGSISLSIAGNVKSVDSLMAITNFLTMPMMFTSNAMYPIHAMPLWLQWIAKFNPVTYAVSTMRTIATKGWLIQEIWPGVLLLVVIAFITISVSTKMFYRSVS